jgi:Tfp pilus assembly protein PilF
MTSSQLFALGLPSLGVWGLLLWHRARLHGWRVVAAFVCAIALYSILRAGYIGVVMDEIGGDRPYLMRDPLLLLGASSPQEIVGWGVAVGLSWALAERASAVLGWRAGPARLSLMAFAVMAAISAAVEGAAIAAGWWRWTLPSDSVDALWSVPGIALLDWGFVALDFLLPFLVWQQGRPWWQRLMALAVFPLHFTSHAVIAAFIPGVPLSGHAIGHVLLLAVLAAAATSETNATRPVARRERLWWMAPLLALGLATWTALVVLYFRGEVGLTSVPLALFALVLLLLETRRVPLLAISDDRPPRARPTWHGGAVFVLVTAAAMTWLWPIAARDRALHSEVQSAAAALGRNDLDAAEQALRRAQDLDPEHVAVLTLRGLVALRANRVDEAQLLLDQALRLNPNSSTTLKLAVVAALRAKQLARANSLATRGRGLYPADLIFRYLESIGSGNSANAPLISLASATPSALNELATVAALVGDDAMLAACREAQRAQLGHSAANAAQDF